MSSKFRYIAISQDRIELKRALGAAIYLHEFLTDHQTSPDGWVYYGKEFGYSWIRAHWLAAPPLRTLKRHMGKLKEAGLAEVRRMLRGGMRVRLLQSVKFAKPVPPPAVQLPLLLPRVARIKEGKPVDNPVENQRNTDSNRAKNGPLKGPKVAPERSKEQVEETIRAVAAAHSLPRQWKTQRELDARRRLLLDQAETLQKKFKNAG